MSKKQDKIDKIDQKILLELDKNPRASFNEIGKKCRVSKEVAQYRFKQLVKNKILTGFYAYLDFRKIGYLAYKILIKYKNVTSEVLKEIIEFAEQNKIIAWMGSSQGYWDLMITIASQDTLDFRHFYNKFFSKFNKFFNEKIILIPDDNYLMNEKYLSNGKLLFKNKIELQSKKPKIDKIDKMILIEISLNSRQSFTEIGKKVNLSYWAVSQRFKKLRKQKVIELLKPRIDFKKLGYSYYHVFIELEDESKIKKMINYYCVHKDCVAIMKHLGKYSLHLEFVIKKEKLNEITLELREQFGNNLRTYEPLLITNEYVMNILR